MKMTGKFDQKGFFLTDQSVPGQAPGILCGIVLNGS